MFVFEACVDSLHSAIQAEKGGAGRLELCSSLSEGGITPSYGMIKAVKKHVKIPVHVLIRPRAGDFCYSETDVEVILEDIKMAGDVGVEGIAFGALTTNGDIDWHLMEKVIALCNKYTLSLTFHRAFDALQNPEQSLQELLEHQIPRLLTSGQGVTVTEGLPTLKTLVLSAMQRISIMPGGGVTEKNAAELVKVLGVTELHGSARSPVSFGQSFVSNRIKQSMCGEKDTLMATDSEKVASIVRACTEVLQRGDLQSGVGAPADHFP